MRLHNHKPNSVYCSTFNCMVATLRQIPWMTGLTCIQQEKDKENTEGKKKDLVFMKSRWIGNVTSMTVFNLMWIWIFTKNGGDHHFSVSLFHFFFSILDDGSPGKTKIHWALCACVLERKASGWTMLERVKKRQPGVLMKSRWVLGLRCPFMGHLQCRCTDRLKGFSDRVRFNSCSSSQNKV